MKNKNILVSLIALSISVVIIIISYFYYQTNIPITIFTSKNSTAEKYADKHFLDKYIVGESQLDKYNKNIEEFSYNVNDDTISITGYNGISSKLIIPKTINGLKVTAIEESLFKESIETIVISNNINNIKFEENQNIKIECFSGNYCNELKNSKNLDVKILSDSEYIDFNNSNVPFEYNLKNKEIELVNYTGKDDVIIVPNKINGYPVTKISFDSFSAKAIYIPNSVKNIGFEFLSKYLTRNFYIICFVTILALIIFILSTINLKNDSLEKKSKNIIIYIISYVYILLVAYFSLTIKNIFTGYQTYILQVIISSLIYIFLTLLLKCANNKSEKFEQKLKENNFITKALQIIDNNEFKDKAEIRGLIQYSDPVSTDLSSNIEKEILELLSKIDKENIGDIKKLIKKRNTIIKQNK